MLSAKLRTSNSERLLNAAEEAHIGKVYMMEEGLAAAFGVGRNFHQDKRASAVIDFGAGTTNIAVVAKGNGRSFALGAHRQRTR
jgi:actin-like ATPase involved in cell morphogenesis